MNRPPCYSNGIPAQQRGINYLNTREAQISYPLQRCTYWIAIGAQILVLDVRTRVLHGSRLRSIDALCRALGASKNLVGRIMKRTNGVRTADGAVLLPALQAGFGCTVVFNKLKEAYPSPSIVLYRCSLATFVDAR